MQLSTTELLQIIGLKEAEIYALRIRIAQLEAERQQVAESTD
jgi:hypothetical protein